MGTQWRADFSRSSSRHIDSENQQTRQSAHDRCRNGPSRRGIYLHGQQRCRWNELFRIIVRERYTQRNFHASSCFRVAFLTSFFLPFRACAAKRLTTHIHDFPFIFFYSFFPLAEQKEEVSLCRNKKIESRRYFVDIFFPLYFSEIGSTCYKDALISSKKQS